MIVKLIVIGALGTVLKGLVRSLKELETGRRTESIQTTALLRSAKIKIRVLRRLAFTQILVNDHRLTLI